MLDLEFEAELNRTIDNMVEFVKPEDWRKIWRELLTFVVGLNRQRVKHQKNLDGSKFEARADQSDTKAMLKKILKARAANGAKQFRYKFDPKGGEVAHVNPVALRHHSGATTTVTSAQFKKELEAKGGLDE